MEDIVEYAPIISIDIEGKIDLVTDENPYAGRGPANIICYWDYRRTDARIYLELIKESI